MEFLKKLICMFIMTLSVIGISSINAFANDDFEIGVSNLNGTEENSARIGDVLKHPEKGWKRYDDSYKGINYSDNIITREDTSDYKYYNGKRHNIYQSTPVETQYIKFSFYGTKLRLIDYVFHDRTHTSEISFDNGVTFEKCSAYGNNCINDSSESLFYKKIGLEKKRHDVIIRIPYEGSNRCFALDALDIDDDGYIIDSENGTGLYIYMCDQNIKQAQNINIEDFIQWYKRRDLNKGEMPFYKITNIKGNSEFLIHDKIVSFEIIE